MANSHANAKINHLYAFFDYIIKVGRSFRFRLFLFVLLIYVSGAALDVTNTNPGSRFMLTKAIAKYGEFTIRAEDLERYSYLDYSEYNGSIFSDKPPGVSVLAIPIYWFGDYIATEFFRMDSWQLIDDVIKFLIILVALIFGAFVVVKFYDLLRLLDISHKSANWTTIIFAFGSLFYVYIGTLFSHGIVAGFLVLTLYQSTKFRKTGDVSSLLWSSFLAGYTVVCDYVFIFFLPFHIIYVLLPFPWKLRELKHHLGQYLKTYVPLIILYLIPIIFSGLLITWYNFSCFDDPLKTPYAYAKYFWDKQHFANPMIDGLDVLLISIHHGLLYFMPIIFVSILGFVPMLKRAPSLATMCITLSLLLILLYSKYYLPTGGLAYGPRFLVPITPLLVLPLGFLLDSKLFRSPDGPKPTVFSPSLWIQVIRSRRMPSYQNIRRIFVSSIIFVLILLSTFLGTLSFLINFAGGWVGVYPLSDHPIYGTDTEGGHLPTLFSWFHFFIEPSGSLSLEFLEGWYEGGFQFKFFILTFKVYLTWPFASTLARILPSVFFSALFLAFLINPYSSPLDWGQRLSRIIKPFNSKKAPTKKLVIYVALEGLLLILFLIWVIFHFLPFLRSFPEILFDVPQNIINSGYGFIEEIPILNIFGYTIVVLFSSFRNIIFRNDPFSLNNWYINIIIFIGTTIFAWIPLRQFQKQNTEDEGRDTDFDWQQSQTFQIYKSLSLALAAIFIFTNIYTLQIPIANDIFYNSLSIFIYLPIFVLTTYIAIPQFTSIELDKNKDEIQEKDNTVPSYFESGIFVIATLIFFIIVSAVVVMLAFERDISLFDFFFLNLPSDIFSLKNWFIPATQPVVVLLGLTLAFPLIVLSIFSYRFFIDLRKIPKTPSRFTRLKQEISEEIFEGQSCIQGIILLGGGLVTFVFLLITELYSSLSTVPDPSVLEIYPEDFMILGLLLLLFVVGLIWGLYNYRNRSSKTEQNNLVESEDK